MRVVVGVRVWCARRWQSSQATRDGGTPEGWAHLQQESPPSLDKDLHRFLFQAAGATREGGGGRGVSEGVRGGSLPTGANTTAGARLSEMREEQRDGRSGRRLWRLVSSRRRRETTAIVCLSLLTTRLQLWCVIRPSHHTFTSQNSPYIISTLCHAAGLAGRDLLNMYEWFQRDALLAVKFTTERERSPALC